MTITSRGPEAGKSTRRPAKQLGWTRMVTIAGAIAALLTGAAAVYLTDIEGALVALALAISSWLFRSGRRLLGVTGLIVVSAVTVYFMGTAAATTIGVSAGVEGTLISVCLTAASTLVLIAGIGWILQRDAGPSFGPWLAVGLVVGGLVVFLVAATLRGAQQPDSAAIELVAENVAFDKGILSAETGSVTVSLENHDLFWHTFTIEELGVDLRVPVSADMTVRFDAPPGEYRFFCDVPGHPEAGMEGTLVVEG